MGRRPNQLIVEFFERGKKLEDSSNRYEHTCKRCREVFPKGRIDSLMGHLLHRCPNISQKDREAVSLHVQQNSSTRSNTLPGPQTQEYPVGTHSPFAPQAVLLDAQFSADSLQTQDMLAFAVQQQSALDTLAEVSRRHLDYSGIPRSVFGFTQGSAGVYDGQELAEQALAAQLQQASADIAHSITTTTPVRHDRNTNFAARKQVIDSSHALQASHSSPPNLSTQIEGSPVRVSQPEQQQSLDSAPLDPQLDNFEATTHHPGTPGDQIHAEDIMTWNPTNEAGRQMFEVSLVPLNDPTPGFGLLSKKLKARTRGRFSDTRRKEVQEIRKLKACIRCRMLKKPCSEGTPCNTCAHVESARLWKGKCLRTKLADDFGLWSTGLFLTRVKENIYSSMQRTHHQALPGRLEARFFPNSDVFMSFALKRYTNSSDAAIVDLAHVSEVGEPGVVWLLDESENICDKLELYISGVEEAGAELEPSKFMRSTAQQAVIMIRAEKAHVRKSPLPSSRSCYNLQNELVKASVELWVATSILSEYQGADLELRYEAAKPPNQVFEPSYTTWTAQAVQVTSGSYSLIKLQLLAALESKCSRLAKLVINELERRLLQRQQVSRFATLISAVMLLNSVERLTGYYRRFDDAGAPSSDRGPNDWPLAESPCKLWPQGEHFADLLVMLLRMRGLPPRTKISPDGILQVTHGDSLSARSASRTTSPQPDGEVEAMAAWLDPLKLRVEDLVVKRDGAIPSADSRPTEWDTRFIARLLLPESL